MNPWTTYLILPIFALANAGVTFSLETVQDFLNPVSLGIILGLVLGKPLGITLLSWLAVKIGLAEFPDTITWKQLFSASWLAGIGFTISLFITNAAFDNPALQATAKLSILTASVLAAIIGWALLSVTSSRYDEVTRIQATVATD